VITHLQEFTGRRDPSAGQAEAARDRGHFSGEHARIVSHDQAFALSIRLQDFKASREHYEEWDIPIARLEQDIAYFHFSYLAERTDAIDLVGGENRKSFTTNIDG
jgi:hypothetical protein